MIHVYLGKLWQEELQMEQSCLTGAGGGARLGSGVAELAAYRCTELEHVQFWRATELGFRPLTSPLYDAAETECKHRS